MNPILLEYNPKPCPWCKTTDCLDCSYSHWWDSGEISSFVMCRKCHACGPTAPCDVDGVCGCGFSPQASQLMTQKAVEAWNTMGDNPLDDLSLGGME